MTEHRPGPARRPLVVSLLTALVSVTVVVVVGLVSVGPGAGALAAAVAATVAPSGTTSAGGASGTGSTGSTTDGPTATSSSPSDASSSASPTGTATSSPTGSPTGSAGPTEPTGSPTTTPTGGPTSPGGGATPVRDALLRWGLSDALNSRAYGPGALNFLAAGTVSVPAGATTLPESRWRARAGDVRIEKRRGTGSTYRLATWDGLRTTPTGAPLPGPAAGRASDHQVVLSGGTGTVDREAGTARVQWRGTVSLVLASGRTVLTATDPFLVVTPTAAQLRATVAGPDLPATGVVLADLPRHAVRLDARQGFTVTPAYAGRRWTAPAGATPAVGGRQRGAWPTSFLDAVARAGAAGSFYATGAPADRAKAPLPVVLSWSSRSPVTPPPATSAPAPSTAPSPTGAPSGSPAPSAAPSSPAPTTPATPAPPAAPFVPPLTLPAPVSPVLPGPVTGTATLPALPAVPVVPGAPACVPPTCTSAETPVLTDPATPPAPQPLVPGQYDVPQAGLRPAASPRAGGGWLWAVGAGLLVGAAVGSAATARLRRRG